MKVAVVGTVGLPACYGGFESLVENLTINSSKDISYTVFCSAKSYDSRLDYYNGAKLSYISLKANGSQSVIYDIVCLGACLIKKPDVILILGVSGCIFLPVFRLFSNSKIVTNIDGLEWKRDKWGKWTKRFLKLSEALAVRYSDAIVTDNKAITDYVEKEYSFQTSTIAYGGDHALRESLVKPQADDYSLALCRIEPENNVHMILEAFSRTEEKLKFVGNWNSNDYGKSLRNTYSQSKNIELLDPIYDLDDLFSLRSGCKLYIHGHSAGGTNPSLVEMMHFGVPILAYDCNFNRYSTENLAHYFISADGLISALDSLDESELNQNGLDMKDVAIRRYTWKEITKQYEQLY